MEVLWAADEPLTSAEVAERLEERGWSLGTIKTMLSRLIAKGAISHREDGRRFLYSPAIERGSLCRKRVAEVRRTAVRRPPVAAGGAPRRGGCARRKRHRRDRGLVEGAEVVTDWLLGTLLATSGLIVLVLLLREPVRRHFGARVAYGLWLIPAARLLMPTISETVERPVAVDFAPRMMTSQVVAEPMLMSGVAAGAVANRADRRLADVASRPLAGRCDRPVRGTHPCLPPRANRHPPRLDRSRPHRLDPARSVGRSQRAFGVRDLRPRDCRSGGFRPALCRARTAARARARTCPPPVGRPRRQSGRLRPCSACNGSIRWHGSLTPPSASTRKPPAMPACWTSRVAGTGSITGERSPKPLRGGRCCSPARSIVGPRFTGGSSPCSAIPPSGRRLTGPNGGARRDRRRFAADRHARDRICRCPRAGRAPARRP